MLAKVMHHELEPFLELSFRTFKPILLVSKPGGGKTDRVKQFSVSKQATLIISHPVTSDPTDYKGLPAKSTRMIQKQVQDNAEGLAALLGVEASEPELQNIAEFLPFGDLLQLIEADSPTIWFLDDLGQAPQSVQAALMQLIGGREVCGHKISDHVRIMAATNGREHKAGVKGLLEPVKSRFGMILELVSDVNSSRKYAYENNWIPAISDFWNYCPEALHEFRGDLGMENSPNPRLWEYLNTLIVESYDLFAGTSAPENFYDKLCSSCIGESWGLQFSAFLKIKDELRSYNEIIANWDDCDLNEPLDVRYATIGMLANEGKYEHAEEIFGYIRRFAAEYQVVFMRTLSARKSPLLNTNAAQLWTAENLDIYLY